jgi:hypothetical protein
MIQRLGVFLLAAGVLFVGLAFADDPPGQPDDPPVRLKKKDKVDPDKTDPAKPPMKDEKKEQLKKAEPKDEPEPATPQEDEAEVLNRVAKNIRMAEEKIANKELGDNTRQLQEDILKDLDSLIRAAENPPQGGGGGDDKQSSSGSMGKQSGKQGSGSSQASRRRQGSGSQQANKGGKQSGSGSQGSQQTKGDGDQGTQQASGKSMGGAFGPGQQLSKGGGGGGKSMEGPNKNADLYKDVWGHLPEALRAEMNAYSNDKQFMAKYDELIKRYYRSIAEEGRKKGGN